jgi:pyruvate-ferredoxin/flavodoxin oxidoreductase
MGAGYQLAVANGQKNLWGEELSFIEPESEHSSASACEGFALAGGRVTNFTSGQGLVLMKEVLYTIAGKRLPVVFHIGARALSSHALNVHAGHDDVMAVADCGWGMLFARNVQEAHDLGLIARRAAEASATPFLSIQDGFLTTHTIENVRLAEPEMMREYVGSPHEKLVSLFDPAQPLQTGTVQNQDAYMKGKIAQRAWTDEVPRHVQEAFEEFHRLTGRRYGLVTGYRLEDAEYAIVGLGSVMETAMPAVDWVRKKFGWKVGLLHVTCFRPFPAREIVAALKGCKAISIIERMDNPLAKDNPLTTEVKASFADAVQGCTSVAGDTTPGMEEVEPRREQRPRTSEATAMADGAIERMPRFHSGVYGLGSRDTNVSDLIAVAQNMVTDAGDRGRTFFSLGIRHPTALERRHSPDLRPKGAFSMRGHSVGGYGSVTTNKVIASLVEEIFGLYVQAFPKYGSDKKGLPTTYYLTVAPEAVREHSEVVYVDFVPVHDTNAFETSDPLLGLGANGVLLVQSRAVDDAELWQSLPDHARETISRRGIRLMYLDTDAIARELAATPDLQLRMQGIVLLGVFLRVAPFADWTEARAAGQGGPGGGFVRAKGLSDEQLFAAVGKALEKYFGRRGPKVVEANLAAVKRGYYEVREYAAVEALERAAVS